jgi:hypothetical protein
MLRLLEKISFAYEEFGKIAGGFERGRSPKTVISFA